MQLLLNTVFQIETLIAGHNCAKVEAILFIISVFPS